MLRVLVAAAILLVASALPTVAQDAVKVDPKHYKVEFENDQVRVLRITYGPHEKSVMHGHPAGVVVFLTDLYAKFTLPDGTTQVVSAKAGTTQWLAAGQHQPENLRDEFLELIQIEFKEKPATGK
jgi:hypothetical protein